MIIIHTSASLTRSLLPLVPATRASYNTTALPKIFDAGKPTTDHRPPPRMSKRKIESLDSGHDTAHRKRSHIENQPSPALLPLKGDAAAPIIAGLAFRISRIPTRISKDQVLQILESLPCGTLTGDVTGGGQHNVLAWSLAPSASSAESENYNTATVTLRSVPIGFPLHGAAVPLNIGLIPNELSINIVVDKNFYGLTPLHSSEHPIVE